MKVIEKNVGDVLPEGCDDGRLVGAWVVGLGVGGYVNEGSGVGLNVGL